MGGGAKAVIAFTVVMVLAFAALYIYRYGLPASVSTAVQKADASQTSTATVTATTADSSSNSSGGSVWGQIVQGFNVTAVLSKASDAVRGLIEWIIGSVKSDNVTTTIVKGAAIAFLFFLAGVFVNAVAKIIRFILYALGAITIIVTALVVLGLI